MIIIFLLFNFHFVNMGNMDQYEVGDGPFGPVVNGTMVLVFYPYRPNQAAGYAFMALFALATLGHIVYAVRLKAWAFVPLILGGIGKQSSPNSAKDGTQTN